MGTIREIVSPFFVSPRAQCRGGRVLPRASGFGPPRTSYPQARPRPLQTPGPQPMGSRKRLRSPPLNAPAGAPCEEVAFTGNNSLSTPERLFKSPWGLSK